MSSYTTIVSTPSMPLLFSTTDFVPYQKASPKALKMPKNCVQLEKYFNIRNARKSLQSGQIARQSMGI